jgi:hypothetical protein
MRPSGIEVNAKLLGGKIGDVDARRTQRFYSECANEEKMSQDEHVLLHSYGLRVEQGTGRISLQT